MVSEDAPLGKSITLRIISIISGDNLTDALTFFLGALFKMADSSPLTNLTRCIIFKVLKIKYSLLFVFIEKLEPNVCA